MYGPTVEEAFNVALLHARQPRGGFVPPEKDFYDAAVQSYQPNPTQEVGALSLMESTPTLKVYGEGNTILLAERGTVPSDTRDLKADAAIPVGQLAGSARYAEDVARLRDLFARYPPGAYEYYMTGHSLGGALTQQFRRDFPFIRRAVVYNSAFQPADVAAPGRDIKRLYTSTDPLYNLGGRLFRGSQVIHVPSGVSGHALTNFATLYKAPSAFRAAAAASLAAGGPSYSGDTVSSGFSLGPRRGRGIHGGHIALARIALRHVPEARARILGALPGAARI